VRKHRWSTNNGSSREKLPKYVCSPTQGVFETPPAKTCLIIALYCIFSRHLVSEYPPQIRGIGGGPDDSQNDSFTRGRPRGHRCIPVKSCSRITSSYGEAGWLQPRDYDLLLESRGLLQWLPAMAQRSPQALNPVLKYQVGPVVRVLVPEDEWNISLVSAQRKGSREGKNTTALGCDPNASTAFPTRLIHQDVPCGNDGIVETSFMRNPCHSLEKFTRRSFQQSFGKPCSVYVNSNRPDRTAGKPKLSFYNEGFPTLPQGLLLLFFNF